MIFASHPKQMSTSLEKKQVAGGGQKKSLPLLREAGYIMEIEFKYFALELP